MHSNTLSTYSGIPMELRMLRQWVCWRYEEREGKLTKPPISAVTGAYASSTNMTTWCSFTDAIYYAEANNLPGIGFVFTEGDPYTGIDIDHCISEQAPMSTEVISILFGLDSYVEYSPSGTGLHVIVRSTPMAGCRTGLKESEGRIEIYSSGRYFTITGNHVPGFSSPIGLRDKALEQLLEKYFPGQPQAPPERPLGGPVRPLNGPVDIDDQSIIERAQRAANGTKFSRLFFAGDTSRNNDDDSSADISLCNILAFWTQDRAQIDRLFRQSALMRPKWDEVHYASGETYGEHTIGEALSMVKEQYQASYPQLEITGGPMKSESPPVELPPILTESEQSQAIRNTFVDDYIAYGAMRTDAPVCFHEAVALVLLSTMVGRRAVLPFRHSALYANLWVNIVAESSIWRKSTALDMGREMILDIDRSLVAPNDFTPTRFCAIISENDGKPLLFCRDEFSGFYSALNRIDWMAGLKEDLCNVYDGRPFTREKMKNKDDEWRFYAYEPFLSMLVGTTREAFNEVARTEDIHGGFLARFAYVLPPEQRSPYKPISMMTEEIENTKTRLTMRLRNIKDGQPLLQIERGALEIFDIYTQRLEAYAMDTTANRHIVSVVGARISWMAAKVAMLLAVADGKGSIGARHIYRGIEIVEGWRRNALDLLGQLGGSKFERKRQRMLEIIKENPGISRRDVMRAMALNARYMDDLEHVLSQREEISIFEYRTVTGKGHRYFPVDA